MVLVSCRTIPSGYPEHCTTTNEYKQAALVDAQRVYIFAPDSSGEATRFREFAYRDDYLEARCRGINAYRGEPDQPPDPPEVPGP